MPSAALDSRPVSGYGACFRGNDGGIMTSDSAVPERIEARLRQWEADGFVSRMLKRDPTLWAPRGTPEIEDRLGWLDLPLTMTPKVEDLTQFGRDVAGEGFTDVVVLGMGGSSLAPEVFQSTFGNAEGHPRLTVLDSTHPCRGHCSHKCA